MHWSPNFQKEGMDYKTIGHLNSENTEITQKNPYMVQMVKTGSVQGYEEIDLFGNYIFFSELPYFTYSSTMNITRNVNLYLLRNDEMTMDSLFTHLVYPDISGKVVDMPLYDRVKLDSLTNAPLRDNIDWVGFINKSAGYGLVSIRLSYDNRNLEGKKSPLFDQQTKISVGSKNGRYWNRRLINEKNTFVPMGSRYYEQVAYLVLDDLSKLDKQIDHYVESLNNPIFVSVSSK